MTVISVEVQDVLIPAGLEDAMSMQAQAERERQARVTLGDSERQVAEKFGEAAKTYIRITALTMGIEDKDKAPGPGKV